MPLLCKLDVVVVLNRCISCVFAMSQRTSAMQITNFIEEKKGYKYCEIVADDEY